MVDPPLVAVNVSITTSFYFSALHLSIYYFTSVECVLINFRIM